MDKLDMVLLMTVNPGFGGQKFIDSVLRKVSKVRSMIEKNNFKMRLEVDGGINLSNIAQVASEGADTFVAGSAIFNQKDYSEVIKKMRSSLESI
jgi:ribulose-phosphate 3-epimerase